MVTHVHPTGTNMEKFTSIFPGSPGVKRAVEKLKPDLLLCSHVHEAEGIEEKVGKTKMSDKIAVTVGDVIVFRCSDVIASGATLSISYNLKVR